jgi:hypothetical protein
MAFMDKGDTLQKKETECRGCGLPLAATAAQSSMTTALADLKHVHNRCGSELKVFFFLTG